MGKRTFFVIAGEPSGDILGAHILRALSVCEDIYITGIGGPLMEAEGQFQSRIPLDELAHMGIARTLRRLPFLINAVRTTRRSIREEKPDILITIDAPEFCLRVSKGLSGIVPRVHCVAPTVWAWRQGRVRTIHHKTDHLLSLFPFEPPYFEHSPVGITFVGHPSSGEPRGNSGRFLEEYPEYRGKKILSLLPGSRSQEIRELGPIFLQTFGNLRERFPDLEAVFLTLPQWMPALRSLVGEHIRILSLEARKWDALAASTAALAASGTVSLDLARERTPMVIAYRVPRLTGWIVKHIIRTPHVALANIVAGKDVVPECLQERCTPETLTKVVGELLENPSKREEQQKIFPNILKTLETSKPFGQACADVILGLANQRVPPITPSSRS